MNYSSNNKLVNTKSLFNKTKISVLFALLFISSYSNSQTFIKVNTIPILVGVPNFGVETKIGNNQTFQFDILASLWKSVDGKPKQFYIFQPEYRFNFGDMDSGYYIGTNLGFTLFNFQKYTSYNSSQYQKGFGYLIGVTFGYKKKLMIILC